MSDMIRKQIYIHKRQQTTLKRLAEASGVSEAEIIRQAIDREAVRPTMSLASSDRSAWEELLEFVATRKANTDNEPYTWRRQDAYDEREARYE